MNKRRNKKVLLMSKYNQAYRIWRSEENKPVWYAVLVYLQLIRNPTFDIICYRLGIKG